MKRMILFLLVVLLLTVSFCACHKGDCNQLQNPSSPTELTDPTENTEPTGSVTPPDDRYTVTFETNGKAQVPATQIKSGEIPTMPQTPVVTNYVFAGWYLDSEYNNRYFFDYPLFQNTTLYAKFYDTTSGEYTVISNIDQFLAIKDDHSTKYLLACDINCKGATLTPIDSFSGELDGNGYKIFNFALTADASSVGLINTNSGVVKNLSFSDFVFDTQYAESNAYYGLICCKNTGTIDNCHILDSEMKLIYSTTSANAVYAGGIAGTNTGTISNCSNSATLSLRILCATSDESIPVAYSYAGGIVGLNNPFAVIENCFNKGKLNVNCTFSSYPKCTVCVGGVVGQNGGSVNTCANLEEIAFHSSSNYSVSSIYQPWIDIGGALGSNLGLVENCYSQGELQIEHNAYETLSYVGGFIGYNRGKLYNCYGAANISHTGKTLSYVGSFAGINVPGNDYESLINKCFATGNLSLSYAPTNIGHFIGESTDTEKDCYYLDSMTITKTESINGVENTTPISPTNEIGTAKEKRVLLSIDFLENTLYFERTIWLIEDGKLPELK